MFTGLVEGKGSVLRVERNPGSLESAFIVVDGGCLKPFDLKLGDSVAVNGCCLTVKAFETTMRPHAMGFQVGHESLACTNLGELIDGSMVNLERALRVGDRLGGHMVYGHIDSTAKVLGWRPSAGFESGGGHPIQRAETTWELDVELDARYTPYCVEKGSLCIDGVSLTIQRIKENHGHLSVGFMIIAATLEKTHFESLRPGSRVNIEVDVMAKWVEKMTRTWRKT